MKPITRYLALTLMIMVFGAYSGIAIGTQTPTQARGDSTFQGTLVKVDPDMQVITARSAEGEELYFSYTDDTKVVGPTKAVEGLVGKAGANLKIIYHVEGASNRATFIQVFP